MWRGALPLRFAVALTFDMQISDIGRKLIESCEGCKLVAYQDTAGVWTIGYGHTSNAGAPPVTAGMKIHADRADEILSADLVQFSDGVNKLLKRVPTQPEFDAMVSLAFNIGLTNFRSSSVLRLFNQGDIEGAANAFTLWEYSGGKKVEGLAIRRYREKALFLEVPYPSMTDPITQPVVHAVDHPDGWLSRIAARIELMFR